ncbi:MAG: Ig-like domain-containing protein [Lacipirellulaceae bacterium]
MSPKSMFRNLRDKANRSRRVKFFKGRSLKYEILEGRRVLSVSGPMGINECAPEFVDSAMDGLTAPVTSAQFRPGEAITFSVPVSNSNYGDGGANATALEDIFLSLDPDEAIRNNGATASGATLTFDSANNEWDFSWTPSEAQLDAKRIAADAEAAMTGDEPDYSFRFFIIASDDGSGVDGGNNAQGTPLSDSYAFRLNVNDNPVFDLDVPNDGFMFTERDPNTPIADTEVPLVGPNFGISFARGGTLNLVEVRIKSPLPGETIQVDESVLAPNDLELAGPNGATSLIIRTTMGVQPTVEQYENVLRTLTYNSTSDDPAVERLIEVKITDDGNRFAAQDARVVITPTNDKPDLEEIPNQSVAFGETVMVTLNATDPDAGINSSRPSDSIIFQITNSSLSGGMIAAPLQTVRNSQGAFSTTFTFQPTAEQIQQIKSNTPAGVTPFFEFTISATDNSTNRTGFNESPADTETFRITIRNASPVAVDDVAYPNEFDISEDADATLLGLMGLIDLLDNDSDPDGDPLVVSGVSVNGTQFNVGQQFTHPSSGALITVDEQGRVTYDPNGQFESLDEGDEVTDTFTYTISDGNGGTDMANATVTILGRNDAPTQRLDNQNMPLVPMFTIDEQSGANDLDPMVFFAAVDDVDEEDNAGTFSLGGVLAQQGFSFDSVNRRISFNPNYLADIPINDTVEIDFIARVEDSSGAVVNVPSKITVRGVDTPPTTQTDSYDANEDETLSVTDRAFGVLGNDSDDGGNAALTVSQVNGQTTNVGMELDVMDTTGTYNGKLTVNSDGTFTFDPQPGVPGGFDDLGANDSATVQFNYTARDANGGESVPAQTVTITVAGRNDAPDAVDDGGANFTTNEDTALVGANVLDNDQDIDGDSLTVFAVNGMNSGVGTNLPVTSTGGRDATIMVGQSGEVTFDPSGIFDSLGAGESDTISFTYLAVDSLSNSNTATVTLTITGVNDAPVIDRGQLASAIQQALGRSTTPDLSQPIQVQRNNLFSFDFAATVSDIDTPVPGVTFSLSENVPNAQNQPSISNGGQFTWTPSANGTFTLTFGAVNSDFKADNVTITFEVVNVVI